MDISLSALFRPVVGKLVALQSFFFARPRLDISLLSNPESFYGQTTSGPSPRHLQIDSDSIPISELKCDLEFFWKYKLRIKNNSSKTAYGIKIEKIYKDKNDFIGKIDDLASLKESEMIELDYILRKNKSMNGREAEKFRQPFPTYLDQILIIVSYTNEGRTKYYTKFIANATSQSNEHLFKKPDELSI